MTVLQWSHGHERRRAPATIPGPPRGRRAHPPVHDRGCQRPRWADAVEELRTLQAEYEAWRDGLPKSLAESRTAELLDGVCDLDVDALDVELPRGFGRD